MLSRILKPGNILRRFYSTEVIGKTLYLVSGQHCTLCFHFKRQLENYLARNLHLRFVIQEIDLKSDDRLFERFQYDIPVLLFEDKVLLKHRVDEMLAVHGGVGTRCNGIDRLCCDAVKKWPNNSVQAVVHLENDPLVNCGFGSSLTSTGRVEVEAGYMSSHCLAFGAVGAVSNTKHPILAAKYLADRFAAETTFSLVPPQVLHPILAAKYLADRFAAETTFSLVPPQVLVGEGADALVRELALPVCSNDELKSPLSVKSFEQAKIRLGMGMNDVLMDEKMDTVGSVYVQENGNSEACVSSGGIILKKDGRLGHSTMFGSAVWAEQRGRNSIAISLSGCGEALTRCRLAQTLANFIFDLSEEEMLPSAITSFCRENFLNSNLLAHFPVSRRIVGGLLIFRQGRMQELVAFHNSEKFSFAFWNGKGVKHFCSEIDSGADFMCNSFPFLIPSRDEDLLIENDSHFYVESVTNDVEEIQEGVTSFEVSEGWQSLPGFFPVLYSLLKNKEVGDRKLRIKVMEILKEHLNAVTAHALDYLQRTDEEVDDNDLAVLKNTLLMYIYLYCRFLTNLEVDYLACANENNAKYRKNDQDAEFRQQFPKISYSCVIQLKDFVCATVGHGAVKVSVIKELYSGNLQPGFARTIISTVLKFLSDPQNQYVRSEVKKFQTPLFQILHFLGWHFKNIRGIAKELVQQFAGFEWLKKANSFVFISAFKDLENPDFFLEALIFCYLQEGFENVEKVKRFSLFIQSVAEHFQTVIRNNFNSLFRLIKNEQGQMRSAILSVVDSLLQDMFTRGEFTETDKVYLNTIKHCLHDQNSLVRNKAMNVLKDLITCHSKSGKFPSTFYAEGVLLDIGRLLNDQLSTVRKTAAQALDEILHKNPFGGNLNINKLYEDYAIVQAELDKLRTVIDNNEIELELDAETVLIKEKATVDFVAQVLKEFIDVGNYPEKATTQLSNNDESALHAQICMDFKDLEKRRAAVERMIQYFFTYIIEDPENINFDETVNQMVKISLPYLAGMTDDNEEERKKYSEEQLRQEKRMKMDEARKKLNRILETMHYALNIEKCMEAAMAMLPRANKDVEAIVHFISRCRNFQIRGSEKAIKEVCKLVYSTDEGVSKFIINSSKDVFFSHNTNETISEQSTVQKMLEVMDGSTMEERAVLTDTLIKVFQNEKLKRGSIDFLWNLAITDKNKTSALVALRILYPHTLVDPKSTQNNFGQIMKVLKRHDPVLQIEAIKLAAIAGRRQSKEELQDLKTKVAKPFKLPMNDNFFQQIVRKLIVQLNLVQSKRWCIRARWTMKAIFNLCTSPDELCNTLISPVLTNVKYLSSQFRIFRHLWKQSIKTMCWMRKKLLQQKLDLAFVLSADSGIDSSIIYLTEELEQLSTQETTQNDLTTDILDVTTGSWTDGLTFDCRKPQVYEKYHRFVSRKKKCQKRRRLEGMKTKDACEFLKLNLNEESENQLQNLSERLKLGKDIPLKAYKEVQLQCISLFALMKNSRKTWQLVLRRLFFLTKEYISRTIQFVNDSLTSGLELVKDTLEELKRLPRGQAAMLQLPSGVVSGFSVFERDNILGHSIFETSKGRMEDATGQSVASVISSHVQNAITYDLFKPGTIVSRVYPIVMQVLRFRRRPPITAELSDFAMSCLLKMMQASVRLCNHHLAFVYHYIKTAPSKTRANILISLSDIAMCYPHTFSRRVDSFLTSIHDKSPSVRLVALLMIYYLNCGKVINLSDDDKAKVAMLLLDCNEDVVNLTKFLFNYMITKCNVSVSGLIRDVLKRLCEYETQEFDFKNVTTFFFGYVKTVAEADSTINAICQTFARLSRINHERNKYAITYVIMTIESLPQMNKLSSKAINRITNEMDKFKIFFKYHKVCKSFQNYINYLKKGCSDAQLLTSIDGMERKLKKIKDTMKFAAKYDKGNITVMSPVETPLPPEEIEIDDVEMNEIPPVPNVNQIPRSPKRKLEDEMIVKTKRLRQSQLLAPVPEGISLNGLNHSESPNVSPSTSIENDENRSRFERSRCNSSTTDN
uniref:Condensin complex subunit 1 C-terminal domain-containing protein n=1 Tax=Panagrolaimus sp. JU765 TaxID=591449 RepID=A0AC34R1Y9_9BILA